MRRLPASRLTRSLPRAAAFCLLALGLAGAWLLPPAPSAYAVDVPIPLRPADGALTTVLSDPPLGVPEFAWTSVPGTQLYRLQISPDIGFATTIVNITTANTSYTPSSVSTFDDGPWYWRVRVETPTAGDYTSAQRFDKQWASADNKPALISPQAGAALDFYQPPAFSWQPVTGAAAYRLQIAADTGFSPLLFNQLTLATTHQPIAKLANGSYYWRVVPVDAGTRDGTPSEARAFTANYNPTPALIEPLADAVVLFTPTFRWEAVLGAQYYRLQYSTDPTFSAGVTQVDTRNTTYTPLDALANDANYYWRVRVVSGAASSDWSASRRFSKQWHTPSPELLTPRDNYPYVKNPFFSWTPVPGASYYKVSFNGSPSFPPSLTSGWEDTTTNPYYVVPDTIQSVRGNWSIHSTWYWQVTPVDSEGNAGLSTFASFGYNPGALGPDLIYPLYYYSPTASLQPHEDRSAATPVFLWQRTLSYTIPSTGPEVEAYRLQVDDSPLFTSVDWTVDTQNLSAAPTADNPFTPTVGGLYYWRVRPLSGVTVSGTQVTGGALAGQWSQVWKTRIDSSLSLTATQVITLLRPVYAAEVVDDAPLLEWRPLQGADAYDVEISPDPAFPVTDTLSARTAYPAYAPRVRPATGDYYWRVRGRSGGAPLGSWSDAWRYQVATSSRWREYRPLGTNRLRLASDPAGDISDASYDLTGLYAAQSKNYWHFGFDITPTTSVTYVLYIDTDHVDGSGAAADPEGLLVATAAAHRPEVAVYLPAQGGIFSAASARVWRWNNQTQVWGTPQILSDIGGALSATVGYVEFQLPATAAGPVNMTQASGSLSVVLFSVLPAGGHAQDSVPSDPDVAFAAPDAGAGVTTLSRWASVSERLGLAYPPNSALGGSAPYASVPPLLWRYPVDATWLGYQFQAAKDSGFTDLAWDYLIYGLSASASPLIPAGHVYNKGDFSGDNTYYWRARPVYTYTIGASVRGAWSDPSSFEREGFVPQNLQTSVTQATPTFTWDMVEGARNYDVQVDNDQGFGSPEPLTSGNLTRNSYTPDTTLANGTYYWRVRARRYAGSSSSAFDVVNDWTPAQVFTLTLPAPTGLAHSPAGAVPGAPTFCWDPLLALSGGRPVLAAYKYRLQVSTDPSFPAPTFDSADTEQTCWTPTRGYGDGTYYWRVAMLDGSLITPKQGAFSDTQQFTKQYPVTTLLSPTSGATADTTPTFAWTPVNGAASYKLEVSPSPTFSPMYDTVTTNNTRYTPIKPYASNSYYWQVSIVDKDGKAGPPNTATIIVKTCPCRLYLPLVRR